MTDRLGRRERALAEPVPQRLAGDVLHEHLDRDPALEADVASQVDDGHPAVAQDVVELVASVKDPVGAHEISSALVAGVSPGWQ